MGSTVQTLKQHTQANFPSQCFVFRPLKIIIHTSFNLLQTETSTCPSSLILTNVPSTKMTPSLPFAQKRYGRIEGLSGHARQDVTVNAKATAGTVKRKLRLTLAVPALYTATLTFCSAACATDLVYASDDDHPVRAEIKDGATGVPSNLTLLPDGDGAGNPIVLDLVLTRADAPGNGTNLLEPGSNWHGSEPFSFSASEFKHGSDSSVSGSKRVIPMHDTRRVLVVNIQDVQLAGCRTCGVELSFGGLKLSVRIRAPSK